jgi:hypothetical protein
MTKKERKQSILEEVLSDSKLKEYSKRKYMEIQAQKSNKHRRYKPSGSKKAGSASNKKARKSLY